MKLEEWYESDAKILAIAGQKAELVEKYGIDEITDQLLMEDVNLRVSAGIGAADPMQGIEKFGMASKVAGEVLMPFVQAGLVAFKPKPDEIINEVFGKAGFKGAFERFFEAAEVPQQGEAQPDPIKMAEIELKREIAHMQNALKEKDLELKAGGLNATDQQKAAERALKERLTRLEHQLRMIEKAADQSFQAEQSDTDRDFQTANTLHQASREDRGREFDAQQRDRDRSFQAADKDRDRAFKAGEGAQTRTFQSQEKDKDRSHTRREQLASRAHQSSEADIDRQLSGMEAQSGRSFQGQQADADRQHQRRESLDSRAHAATEADKGRQQQTALAKLTAKAKAEQGAKPTPKK